MVLVEEAAKEPEQQPPVASEGDSEVIKEVV